MGAVSWLLGIKEMWLQRQQRLYAWRGRSWPSGEDAPADGCSMASQSAPQRADADRGPLNARPVMRRTISISLLFHLAICAFTFAIGL